MNRIYHTSAAHYSPNGLVKQIDYASEVVAKSFTIIGILGKDAVVLAVDKSIGMDLHERGTNEHIYIIDKHIGMAMTGFTPDGHYVAAVARKEASTYRQKNSQPISLHLLCERIAGYIHAHTMYSAARPYGLSIIMASWDANIGPQLYKIDTSGSLLAYQACASGIAMAQAMDELSKLESASEMDTEQLATSAGVVLYKTHNFSTNTASLIEMGVVGRDTEGMFQLNPTELTNMARSAGDKSSADTSSSSSCSSVSD